MNVGGAAEIRTIEESTTVRQRQIAAALFTAKNHGASLRTDVQRVGHQLYSSLVLGQTAALLKNLCRMSSRESER